MHYDDPVSSTGVLKALEREKMGALPTLTNVVFRLRSEEQIDTCWDTVTSSVFFFPCTFFFEEGGRYIKQKKKKRVFHQLLALCAVYMYVPFIIMVFSAGRYLLWVSDRGKRKKS